jgi:hypothetical protein
MTSNNPNTAGIVGTAVGKGCLVGVGLAVGFFLISGLVYLLLGPFGLERNIRLLITVLSGPVLGTGLTLIVGWALAQRTRRRSPPGPPYGSDQ